MQEKEGHVMGKEEDSYDQKSSQNELMGKNTEEEKEREQIAMSENLPVMD
jgi:hypothetical protein